MISNQIERLQKDSSQLENFIRELQEEGNYKRANKIIAKKEFLDNRLTEIMTS